MLKLIVAVADGGVIGYQNAMPWQIPEDLAYFKAKTLGHTVVMGRKTYISIGKALPKRHNVVISRDKNLKLPDAEMYNELFAALRAYPDAFVIGGATVFEAALPYIHRLYLTQIALKPPGDTFFTIPAELKFELIESKPAISQSGIELNFQVYRQLAPLSLPLLA